METHELKIGESKKDGAVYIFIDGVRVNLKFGSTQQACNFVQSNWMELFLCKGIFAGSN